MTTCSALVVTPMVRSRQDKVTVTVTVREDRKDTVTVTITPQAEFPSRLQGGLADIVRRTGSIRRLLG